MYKEFYGLKEKPFSLTPDPKFLYLSQKHREAMEHIGYGIAQKEGFVLITGDIGTGKTTICRAMVNKMNNNAAVALMLNPFFSVEELLRYILKDLGITHSGTTKLELLEVLNQFLIRHASRGGITVLIIDEAQNLSLNVLEQIRILSNLETEKEKLLQIVLVGQAELREKLKLPKLRQLDQRISVRYHINPLDTKEISKYIYHRLAVAGSGGRISFSRIAFRKIAKKYSMGVPRLINLICDRALLNGYAMQKYHINTRMVVQAVKSLRDEEKTISVPTVLSRASLTILFGAIFLILGWFFYYSLLHNKGAEPQKSTASIKIDRPQNSKDSPIFLPVQSSPQKTLKEDAGAEIYILDDTLPYTLHVASFRTQKQALEKSKKLKYLNRRIYIAKANIPEKGISYRILIGKFKTQKEALEVRRELKNKEGLDFIHLMKAISEDKERKGQ